MVNTSQYLITKILRVTAFDIDTGEVYAVLNRINNATFTNGQERNYVESQGVKIAALDYGKSSTLSAEHALVTDGILALQTGSEVETITNTSEITYTDMLKVTDNKTTTAYKATGTTGAEIKYVYLKNSDGSLGKRLEQSATAATGKFAYDPDTKEITFNSGELADGTGIVAFYKPLVSSAKKIISDANTFSKSANVVVDLAVQNACNQSKTYLGQLVFENGRFSGAFEWSMDGTTPPVQSFEIESMLPCDVTELWKLFVYDEEDIVG